jgi:hypothetical protein
MPEQIGSHGATNTPTYRTKLYHAQADAYLLFAGLAAVVRPERTTCRLMLDLLMT